MNLHVYWFNNDVPETFRRIATRSIIYKADQEADSILQRFKDTLITILYIHIN